MKLRTEKGKWIVIDKGRRIDFDDCALAALDYCLIMKDLRKQIKPLPCLYPVKSLTPRPKKRRRTKKWKDRIFAIQQKYQLGIHAQ